MVLAVAETKRGRRPARNRLSPAFSSASICPSNPRPAATPGYLHHQEASRSPGLRHLLGSISERSLAGTTRVLHTHTHTHLVRTSDPPSSGLSDASPSSAPGSHGPPTITVVFSNHLHHWTFSSFPSSPACLQLPGFMAAPSTAASSLPRLCISNAGG